MAAMKLLLLLRHAVTEQTGGRLSGWTPGLHLSDAGREQADQVGEDVEQFGLAGPAAIGDHTEDQLSTGAAGDVGEQPPPVG